jgi:hypothetical protein
VRVLVKRIGLVLVKPERLYVPDQWWDVSGGAVPERRKKLLSDGWNKRTRVEDNVVLTVDRRT